MGQLKLTDLTQQPLVGLVQTATAAAALENLAAAVAAKTAWPPGCREPG